MNYTLYICNHCQVCEKVVGFLRSNSIVIKEINIDVDKVENDTSLLVVPALFSEGKVIAYGADIIEYMNQNKK